MQRYEYKILEIQHGKLHQQDHEKINEYGEEGWQLIIVYWHPIWNILNFVFEKEK